VREHEILWLRLRDHLEDFHEFNGERLDRLTLLALLRRHRRQHGRRRTHWHPRRLILPASAGGACASERLSSRPPIGSDVAGELVPALS
jgi:hypothetical protein